MSPAAGLHTAVDISMIVGVVWARAAVRATAIDGQVWVHHGHY